MRTFLFHWALTVVLLLPFWCPPPPPPHSASAIKMLSNDNLINIIEVVRVVRERNCILKVNNLAIDTQPSINYCKFASWCIYKKSARKHCYIGKYLKCMFQSLKIMLLYRFRKYPYTHPMEGHQKLSQNLRSKVWTWTGISLGGRGLRCKTKNNLLLGEYGYYLDRTTQLLFLSFSNLMTIWRQINYSLMRMEP